MGEGIPWGLRISGGRFGGGQGAGLSWQGEEPQAVHPAPCSCHCLPSASTQLGMAGPGCHCILHEESKGKELMNNRKKHSDHHLLQGGGTSAEQSALVRA